MALNFNGVTPSKVVFNGTNLSTIIYNGVTVWGSFTSKTFNYTGSIQEFEVPYDGIYTLEVYGAKGGGSGGYDEGIGGGFGGYSRGDVQLTGGTKLYIVVGGTGGNSSENNEVKGLGGYNGGGNGTSYSGHGGGGCTHIGTFNNTLASHGSTSGLYIVAGGGGGSGNYGSGSATGGDGGGTTGRDGWFNTQYDEGGNSPKGGSQTAGGKGGKWQDDDYEGSWDDESFYGYDGVFGRGGNGVGGTAGGGGGGLYGGGGGASQAGSWAGGAGGSGYIGGCTANTMMLTGVNSAPKAIITLKQDDSDITSANNFYVVQNRTLTNNAINPTGTQTGDERLSVVPGVSYSGTVHEEYWGTVSISVSFNNPNNLKFVTLDYTSSMLHHMTDIGLNHIVITGYKADGSATTLFSKSPRKEITSTISQNIKGYTSITITMSADYDGHSAGINAWFNNIYVHN